MYQLWLLVLLVAATKILAVEVGTSINLAHINCWTTSLTCPVCPVDLPAMFVPATCALVEVDFYKVIRHKQATSLRYP